MWHVCERIRTGVMKPAGWQTRTDEFTKEYEDTLIILITLRLHKLKAFKKRVTCSFFHKNRLEIFGGLREQIADYNS